MSRAVDVVVESSNSRMIAHWVEGSSVTPSATAMAQASSIASSRTPRHVSIVEQGTERQMGARSRGSEDRETRCLVPEDRLLALADQHLERAAVEERRCPLQLLEREIVRGDGDERREALLDDLHAPDAVGLEARDGACGDTQPEPLANHVNVLETVQERDHDALLDCGRVDLVERLLELVGLHGDQQDAHGLRELLAHLDTRNERRPSVDLEREPGQREHASHVPPREAHRVDPGLGEMDGERAADRAGAEDGDG